jgi:hypothetical protein
MGGVVTDVVNFTGGTTGDDAIRISDADVMRKRRRLEYISKRNEGGVCSNTVFVVGPAPFSNAGSGLGVTTSSFSRSTYINGVMARDIRTCGNNEIIVRRHKIGLLGDRVQNRPRFIHKDKLGWVLETPSEALIQFRDCHAGPGYIAMAVFRAVLVEASDLSAVSVPNPDIALRGKLIHHC